SRRERLGTMRGFSEPGAGELAEGEPFFSVGREPPRDVEVRADAKAGRRVVFADIGEEEEHEQRAPFRSDVHAPLHEVRLVLRAEAHVDVPAAVAGILRRRKTDGKG